MQLTACGFHLKGMADNGVYGFKSIQIISNSATHRDVVIDLKRQLITSNVEVFSPDAAKSTNPELVLELDQTLLKSSTTSTNGLGAETSELLTMSQAYVVTDTATDKVVAQGTAKVWRDRLINNAARLASESELRQIQSQMRTDLSQQILQRLQRLPRVESSSALLHSTLPNVAMRAQ